MAPDSEHSVWGLGPTHTHMQGAPLKWLHILLCRVLASLSDPNRALHADGFAAGCNCLVVMQETMKVSSCLNGLGRGAPARLFS